MAKNIGYKLVANATPTAEAAPYTGMAIPVGSLAYDNILTAMLASGTRLTKATAKFFLDAFFEYAAEACANDTMRVSTGTVSVYPAISGSFPSEDAPFDPLVNALYVGASFSQALRDKVAGVEPGYSGDEDAVGSVRVDSEMDIESSRFKTIDGVKAFRLAGRNLTVPDGEDESIALYSKDGLVKKSDVIVTENDGGQRITCKLKGDVAVPKGTYKLRIASHGIDPTDPLTVTTVTVTLVTAVTPTIEPYAESSDHLVKITSIKNETDGVEGQVTGQLGTPKRWTIGGLGFTRLSLGGYAKISITESHTAEMQVTVDSDTKMTYTFNTAGEGLSAGLYPDAFIMFPYNGEFLDVHAPLTILPEA